jgi:hypothetical protein
MPRQKLFVTVLAAAVIATALACGRSSTPTTPSVTTPGNETAQGDSAQGATLKVPAPTLVSPLNDAKLDAPPVLTATAVNGLYVSVPGSLSYEFEVYDASNNRVVHDVRPGPTDSVTAQLEFEKHYTWRVRAVYSSHYGPWSTTGSFIAPTGGYIRGAEVYDPLTNGKTVGEIHGPVTFIPNVGVRLETESSWITYPNLTQGALTSGTYSAIYTNLSADNPTEDPKNAIMSMSEERPGNAFNDNRYRMSVEVRGNGVIAFRFLAGTSDYAQTFSSERRKYGFHEALTYFVESKWGGNFFNLMIREGGFSGKQIYNFGKRYGGTYQPKPHMAYVGRPWTPGTRDQPASYAGAVVRQVWISNRARPSSINQ